MSPLPSLVTVQGVLAAFKRLGVLDSVLDEAGGRTARAGGPRGPLGRRRGRPAAGRAGRSAAAAAEAAAAAAAAAEAAHVSPFGRAEGGGTPQGEDEGGLEPLAMDKSFSVAFASQLSAAGDAVCPSGGAPPGESAAERIARIVTPRASARAKAAKVCPRLAGRLALSIDRAGCRWQGAEGSVTAVPDCTAHDGMSCVADLQAMTSCARWAGARGGGRGADRRPGGAERGGAAARGGVRRQPGGRRCAGGPDAGLHVGVRSGRPCLVSPGMGPQLAQPACRQTGMVWLAAERPLC